MRYSTIVALALAIVAIAVHAPAGSQPQPNSPYTVPETFVINAFWARIRGAARYEDINWQALGLPGEPGSEEARRLMAQHWRTLRGAAQFTDINWAATTGYGSATAAATPEPAAAPPAATPRAGTPAAPASPATPGALTGTWVGTLETYPSFLKLTLDLPAAGSANAPVQGTLRVDGGLTAQGGATGQTTVTAQLDLAARALTLTLGREAPQLRLPAGELYAFLDPQSETLAGIVANPAADATPFFVLTRQRSAGDVIFKPIAAAQTQPGAGGPLGALRQMRGGTSRGDLERWVRPLVAEYPEPNPYPPELEVYKMARGLFADEYFEPTFGTTFDRMDAGERNRVLLGIREVPFPRTTAPGERPAAVLKILERSFMPIVGTGTASDMVLSAIALRHLTAWRAGTVAQFGALGETLDAYRTATAVDTAASHLSPYLWPSQRAELAAAAGASRTRAARAPLVAEVDRLLAGPATLEGIRALDAALKISPAVPQSAIELAVRPPQPGRLLAFAASAPSGPAGTVSLAELAQWAPAETWQSQQARLNAGVDSLLTKMLTDGRATLGLASGNATAATNPTARLTSSKAWYERNREIFERFAARSVVAAFLNDLGAQREADFGAALPQMSARLASLGSADEAQRYGRELAIDLDRDRSPSWRSFEGQRGARLDTLDREARAARVGSGPFGPDYPGAVYLNALYRGDHARLAAEDRAVSEPLARTMTQMLTVTGMDALTSVLSGGAVPQGGLSALLNAEMQRYSVAQPLAGFFIVAYERVYPECMEPDAVVFEETITWDTVVTNGFGTEIAHYPGSQTNYYTVNRRHAAVFNEVGTSTDPDSIDFTTTLFGAFLPQGLTGPLNTVSDTLRGLRLAMTENECDSEIITRIERNLMAHAMGN